jgi:hypothetical protein
VSPMTGTELPGLLIGRFGEATVKCCGVTVAMPQEQSRVPTSSSDQRVNTGTIPDLPPGRAASTVIGAGSVVDRSDRDGTEPP